MPASKGIAVVMLAALLLDAGCSAPTLTSPSGAPLPSDTVAVFVQINGGPGPAFTLTLGENTITTMGDHRLDVRNGIQLITGNLTVPAGLPGLQGISIRIHGLEGIDVGRLGGPERGTLKLLEGSPGVVGECTVDYMGLTAPADVAVRFQFNANRAVSIDRRC